MPVSTWDGIGINDNRVTVIVLEEDSLNGPIPPSIGNLSNLAVLNLTDNKLSGSIPSSLGNLTNLRELYLSGNKLTDSIPSSLGYLKNLIYLYLDHNQLNGKIPNTFNQLSCVRLWLSYNHLSGKLINFSNTPRSVQFDISHNNFTFAGLLKLVRRNFNGFAYWRQGKLPIHKNGNTLSVYTGGEYQLKHDNFKWYEDGILVATIKQDSAFTPTENGRYSVVVNNSVVTKLTLYSDTINFSTGDNLVAYKMNNNSAISLYPNPAKTNATLSFYADGKYTIIVTDVSGKRLQTKTGVAIKGINIIQLDVSKYASGLYLITIIDENNRKQTLKLNKE